MNRVALQTSRPSGPAVDIIVDGKVRPRLGALDVWAFALPAISLVEVTIVGRLYLTEVLMLAILPWLWSAKDRPRLPRWFVVLWAGWLVGQIVTDLVIGSAFDDYTRGWSAIVFTLTDFAAILVLAATPKRARLFALGGATGGLLMYLIVPDIRFAVDPWKWVFAGVIGVTLAVALSGSRGARRPWLTVSCFALFGVANLALGFRSYGGVFLLTAGYLAIQSMFMRHGPAPVRSLPSAAGRLMVLAFLVVGVLQVYDVAASQGMLGERAQAIYVEQAGSLGVLVGGRSEVLVSAQAVIDSPIIGHGSWAKDFTYIDMLSDRLAALDYTRAASFSDLGLIPAHSYLMGSWVWAGLLGGVFWIAIAAVALWTLVSLQSSQIALAPLLVLTTFNLLWGIAFSPYSGLARLDVGFAVAMCLLGLRLTNGIRLGDNQNDPHGSVRPKVLVA
jgi:hypothetical protein